MKYVYLSFLLSISVCQAEQLNGFSETLKTEQKKTWTVFTYIAADNDLNPYAIPNMQQMMRVGSNDERTFLAYVMETKQGKKYGKLLRIDKDAIIELTHDENVDSGNQKTCFDSCVKAFTHYPADHYALIFWDHGSGCLNKPFNELFRGIAYDEPLNTYLNDKDLVQILQKISHDVLHDKKIDILGFDACLMASVELQTLCAPYVNYYVASEENEDSPGWDYTGAFEGINKHSTPKEVAQGWVKAFAHLYAPQTDLYTLSAVDLSNMQALTQKINTIAQLVTQLLDTQSADGIWALLQHATNAKNITCFDTKNEVYDYVDLDHFYANLIQEFASYRTTTQSFEIQNRLDNVVTLLKQGRKLIGNAVIANTAGKIHAQAKGISIYWAQELIHYSYSSLLWTHMHPHWQTLMEKYLSTKLLY